MANWWPRAGPRTEMEKSWQRGGCTHDDVLISFYHAIYSCPPQSKAEERGELSPRWEIECIWEWWWWSSSYSRFEYASVCCGYFASHFVSFLSTLSQTSCDCMRRFLLDCKNKIIARFPISKQKIAIFSRGNKIFPNRVVFFLFLGTWDLFWSCEWIVCEN